MAEINPLTNTNQNPVPDVNTPTESDVSNASTETGPEEELEELEELVIEDFTIDGICGVY